MLESSNSDRVSGNNLTEFLPGRLKGGLQVIAETEAAALGIPDVGRQTGLGIIQVRQSLLQPIIMLH